MKVQHKIQQQGSMELQEKFIGYIDVLGFKKMLETAASQAGQSLGDLIELVNSLGVPGLQRMVESTANRFGKPVSELVEVLKILGSPEDAFRFKRSGPSICPESKYVQRDLNFQIRQISDCVLVSAEISPAGVINVIGHCWTVVLCLLLQKGIMCRGFITKGLIYHTDTHLDGSEPGRCGAG